MVELAEPEQIQGGESRLITAATTAQTINVGSNDFPFFRTTGNGLWRLRFVNATGTFGGAPGNVALGLSITGQIGAQTPWANLALEAQCPHTFAGNESWSLTWGTEIGNDYGNNGSAYGFSEVMGLPLVWLGRKVDIAISFSQVSGGPTELVVDGGIYQIEYLDQGLVGGPGGAGSQSVYLLPLVP
jgi:hypothetical protein